MVNVFSTKRSIAKAIGQFFDLNDIFAKRKSRYILCYHRVISAEQAAAEYVHRTLWISPETFDSQVKWMKTVGEIVSYERIIDFDTPNDYPLFAITFDDGWRDNYEYALPILKQNDICALIFLATKALEKGTLLWPEDLVIKTKMALGFKSYEIIANALNKLSPNSLDSGKNVNLLSQSESVVEALKTIPEQERINRISKYYECIGVSLDPLPGYMLTWAEANEMLKERISFGSHTHTHRICALSSEEDIERELIISRQIIESELKCSINAFAYPNARYSGFEGKLLARNGYHYGFRLHNKAIDKWTDQYFIPRFISYEALAAQHNFFKLRLLEIPFYKGR